MENKYAVNLVKKKRKKSKWKMCIERLSRECIFAYARYLFPFARNRLKNPRCRGKTRFPERNEMLVYRDPFPLSLSLPLLMYI